MLKLLLTSMVLPTDVKDPMSILVFLVVYGLQLEKIPIFCDNTRIIAITENHVQHSMTKHIDNMYHFIREHMMNDTGELHFVLSEK